MSIRRMSWTWNRFSSTCLRKECRLMPIYDWTAQRSWLIEEMWSKNNSQQPSRLLQGKSTKSSSTLQRTLMAYSHEKELDSLNGALSAALSRLEKITSEGLSKKFSPVRMLRLQKAKKQLRSIIDLLTLLHQEIS